MKRNIALILFALACVAVYLGGVAGGLSLFRIVVNFFMFVIPASAAVLLLLYGLAIIATRLFHLQGAKVLRFVCTFFPLPVAIACFVLVRIGLINTEMAISCLCLSVPLMLLVWWRK